MGHFIKGMEYNPEKGTLHDVHLCCRKVKKAEKEEMEKGEIKTVGIAHDC